MSRTVPFVVGQWVRGASFYGRSRELDGLLARDRGCAWVCGLRRVGKTSLLRQLELLAGERGRLPLFWDLQGVDDGAELALSFADALLDAGEALAARGIAVADVPTRDLATAVAHLLAALEARRVPLLLLCDEADELVSLAESHPDLASALGRALLASTATVVLACSPRGVARARDVEAGGLFTPLTAPLALGALTDDEARQLVRQSRLPTGSRPGFDEPTVEAIRARCGNHPMLLQLVGRRCLEIGDVDEACRLVTADRTLEHLFAVDLGLLAADERDLLISAARDGGARRDDAALRRLIDLGLLRCDGAGRVDVGNSFLATWLRNRHAS